MIVQAELTKLQAGIIVAQTPVEHVTESYFSCENPAVVQVKAGITKNMGNYNSLRVEVSVSAPCDPTRVEETTALLREFVGAQCKSMLEPKAKDDAG